MLFLVGPEAKGGSHGSLSLRKGAATRLAICFLSRTEGTGVCPHKREAGALGLGVPVSGPDRPAASHRGTSSAWRLRCPQGSAPAPRAPAPSLRLHHLADS